MSHEEDSIISLLKGSPHTGFARREIARRAVKRSIYEQNPRWVDEPLAALVARGVVVIDQDGLYHLTLEGVLATQRI